MWRRLLAHRGRLALSLAGASIASMGIGQELARRLDLSGDVALLTTSVVPGILWVLAAVVLTTTDQPGGTLTRAAIGLYGLAFVLPAATFGYLSDKPFLGFVAFAWAWIAFPAWAANPALLIALELRRRRRARRAAVVAVAAFVVASSAAARIGWFGHVDQALSVDLGFVVWAGAIGLVAVAAVRASYSRATGFGSMPRTAGHRNVAA